MSRAAQVIICGAGVAGISSAYHLAKAGIRNILIVDPLPPLSLTSDRSTEGYRNWWPDAEMVALMNRSIDIMEQLAEQTSNRFRMNRRGYVYVTADEAALDDFVSRAAQVAAFGAGPVRTHATATADYSPGPVDGLSDDSGADLLLGPDVIHKHFPYLSDRAVAALHVRRAGWLSAQQLGIYLLEEARRLGVNFESTAVEQVDCAGGAVRQVRLSDGRRVACETFVNAAGPHLRQVGQMLGLELPVRTELHLKVTFNDHLGILDRAAPLLIWDDAQSLPWDQDEGIGLASDPELEWLTRSFPAGAHVRPEGSGESRTVLMLWDYQSRWMDPVFPPPLDEYYPEVALRGLATMVPGLSRYFGRAPRPYLDGGYYVKTPENRLLACPLPIGGCYVIGALSGYGIMSSCAAGELLAAHVTGAELPPYAAAFSIRRYEDAAYRHGLASWEARGEL